MVRETPTDDAPDDEEVESDASRPGVGVDSETEADDVVEFGTSADAGPPAEPAGNKPWIVATVVTGLVQATFAFSLQGERKLTDIPFIALGSAYLATSAYALHRLKTRREISLIRPRSGDVSIGAVVAVLLYGLVYATHVVFTAKGPRAGWVFSVYMLLGDPFSDRHHFVALGLALIGVLEELTWRGLVLPLIEERSGTLRASVTTSILYAAAHMPTMFLLSNPMAGPNPMLVLAALGCGLVFSYLRFRTERLAPVLLAHGLFTWAIVEFPIWRP